MTARQERDRWGQFPPSLIYLSDQARDILVVTGRRSRDQERGGILVGYREGHDVYVEDALPVSDPTAGHSSYLRRARPAEQVLAAYLQPFAETEGRSYVGYVGEWHTHPLPAPPSPTDHAAMRTMSRANRQPVAMLVIARHDETTVSFHGLVSVPDRIRHRLAGRHVTATVQHNWPRPSGKR